MTNIPKTIAMFMALLLSMMEVHAQSSTTKAPTATSTSGPATTPAPASTTQAPTPTSTSAPATTPAPASTTLAPTPTSTSAPVSTANITSAPATTPAPANTTECKDKPKCSGLTSVASLVCQYTDVISDCPILCNSSCEIKECSSGFVSVNNQCLMFSAQRLTWGAAKEDCERLNSSLVVPADFQKLAFYIIRNNLFYWQYWVGASDQSQPGNYTWLDNTVVDSKYWYPGFPSTTGVYAGQSCVKLYPNSNTALIAAWDTNCNGTYTNRFICQE